jgi:hypothetical protein
MTRLQSVTSDDCGIIREDILNNTHPTVQRTQSFQADCVNPVPFRAVNSCSPSTHIPTQAAGQSCSVISDGDSKGFFCSESLERAGGGLKGEDSHKHGTAGDHCFYRDVVPDNELSEEFPDTVVSDAINDQSRGSVIHIVANHRKLNFNYVRRDLSGCEPNTHPEQSPADRRSLRKDDVSNIVRKVNLSEAERNQLSAALMKYLDYLTTKPGKCNLMEYNFQVKSDQPIISHSRPVPFSQRPAVHEQIQQMLADDILECSQSYIVNPLQDCGKRKWTD